MNRDIIIDTHCFFLKRYYIRMQQPPLLELEAHLLQACKVCGGGGME
jgi:hypothetical protein